MPTIGEAIVAKSYEYIGYPYVWATHGPDTFDCSGLVHWCVLQVTGDWITPSSVGQFSLGNPVPQGSLLPGDLLFYDTNETGGIDTVGHVGIYASPGKMVNALNESTGVVESNPFSTYFQPRYLGARRLYTGNIGTPTNPPGIVNPTFAGSKQLITNVLSSPDSASKANVKDGTTWTNWAIQGSPSSASIVVDVGSTKTLSGVRWMFAYLGFADQFTIETASAFGGPWTNQGTFGNATATYTWHGKVLNGVSARFVRFTFANPNGDTALGSIGEIEVWAGASVPPTWTHQIISTTNLRSGPGTSQTILAGLPAGEKLKLLGPTASANGYTWYQVQTEHYGTGWCVDNFTAI